MNTLQRLYDTQLVPALEKLYRDRSRLIVLALLSGALIQVGFFCLALYISIETPFLSCLVVGGIFGGWCLFEKYLYRAFQRRYQEQIVKPLVAQVLPTLSYEPEGYIERSRIAQNGVIDLPTLEGWLSGETFEAQHYFSGQGEGVAIEFCQVRVARRRGKTEVVEFDGLIVAIDFHKQFKGRSIIVPNDMSNALEKIMYSCLPAGMKVVTTENERFNRTFITYADDRLENRYVLSETLMQRMLDLSDQLQRGLDAETPSFGISGTQIMIAIPCYYNLLNQQLWWERNSYEHFERLGNTLHLVGSTVTALAMDSRIWTKR